MILSGQQIEERKIVNPFMPRTRLPNGLTYGCGPASYDVRVEFDEDGERDQLLLPPGEFALVSTMEQFYMPLDVAATVHDKSTWARLGLAVQNTFIDPGWTGYLTLELTNHSETELILERGEPIAQLVFHQVGMVTHGYSGKYQAQERGPVKPR